MTGLTDLLYICRIIGKDIINIIIGQHNNTLIMAVSYIFLLHFTDFSPMIS